MREAEVKAARRSKALALLLTVAEEAPNNREGSLDKLGAVRSVQLFTEKFPRAIVTEARAQGFTWRQIGGTLNVTCQAAQQKYGGQHD